MGSSFWSTIERGTVALATGGLSEVIPLAAKGVATTAKGIGSGTATVLNAAAGATGLVVGDVFRGATGLVSTTAGGASEIIKAQGDAVRDALGGAGSALSALRPTPAATGAPISLAGTGGLMGGEPMTSSTPLLLAALAAGAILIVALSHKKPAAPRAAVAVAS